MKEKSNKFNHSNVISNIILFNDKEGKKEKMLQVSRMILFTKSELPIRIISFPLFNILGSKV
jgi:hypothetical protein